ELLPRRQFEEIPDQLVCVFRHRRFLPRKFTSETVSCPNLANLTASAVNKNALFALYLNRIVGLAERRLVPMIIISRRGRETCHDAKPSLYSSRSGSARRQAGCSRHAPLGRIRHRVVG